MSDGKCRCVNCFELYDKGQRVCPHCGYKDGDAPQELSHIFPGLVLNERYVIGKSLGFGGFGITYKAWDQKLDTVVAVKEYYPAGIVNRMPGTKEVAIYAQKRRREYDLGKERFLNEARNMAKFNSETNIVNVFEFFEENNTAYIVMEFLDGENLSQLVHDKGVVDIDYGVKVATAVCSALSKLHSVGIIHRDISPDNIFLCSDGRVKLIDFGAARFSGDENKKMTIILKPGFAPPEQYEKINKQGAWTDIYALGATLYYIITGAKPEESTNRKVNDTLVYPHEINPKIPKNMSNTIMKSMAVDVPLRFKNVKDFSEALNKNKKILPVAVERKRRKNRRFAGITAAAVILAGGGTFSYVQWNEEKEAETLPPCGIIIWYCMSGDEDADKEELAAYEAIIKDFNSSFGDVKISVKGFNKSEYEKVLKDDSPKPNIYEYVGTDISEKKLSLESVYGSDFAKECSLLKDAKDFYGNYDYLPLGCTVPVFFKNIAFEDTTDGVGIADKAFGIKSVSELDCPSVKNALDYVVDDELFLKMYDMNESEVNDSLDTFTNDIINSSVYYGTYSDNYFTLQSDMAARYEMYYCDVDKVQCRYENVWCAFESGDKDENKASLRLLEFILNSNAQDELHIQHSSNNFPINDKVMQDYTTVYHELDLLLANKEKFTVEKSNID